MWWNSFHLVHLLGTNHMSHRQNPAFSSHSFCSTGNLCQFLISAVGQIYTADLGVNCPTSGPVLRRIGIPWTLLWTSKHRMRTFSILVYLWFTARSSMQDFLKWWYPTTMGFPTENDRFGVWNGGTTIWGNTHIKFFNGSLRHPKIFSQKGTKAGKLFEGIRGLVLMISKW